MSRSSIATTTITAMLCAALAACTASATDDTGSVQVALTGTAPSGAVYRLRNAELAVTGGGATHTFSTETDPTAAAITASLQPGDYTLEIPGGWYLERRHSTGTFQRVEAVMSTPNPQPFSIAEPAETRVTLRFQAGADEIPLDDGTLTVDIGIDEIDAAVPDAAPPDASPPDAGVPTGPIARGHIMKPGEILPAGAILTPQPGSPIEFLVRPDGNVVLRSTFGIIVWQSNTIGSGGTVLAMQPDGDLVLYRDDATPVWSSQTHGHPGAYLTVTAPTISPQIGIYTQAGDQLWRRP